MCHSVEDCVVSYEGQQRRTTTESSVCSRTGSSSTRFATSAAGCTVSMAARFGGCSDAGVSSMATNAPKASHDTHSAPQRDELARLLCAATQLGSRAQTTLAELRESRSRLRSTGERKAPETAPAATCAPAPWCGPGRHFAGHIGRHTRSSGRRSRSPTLHPTLQA